MKIATYLKNLQLREKDEYQRLVSSLSAAGNELCESCGTIPEGTETLLSIGGDGTFLSAARMVAGTDIPVLGVNLGRLGFLSEYTPDEVISDFAAGRYTVEKRDMLEASVSAFGKGEYCPYALNEITIHRAGTPMLGINVSLDGVSLPTYWADGILVATSSGSTAYALSVGGPICTPDSRVLIIAPISPHNLNLRPLIVPSSTKVHISIISREKDVQLTLDDRHYTVGSDVVLDISLAQFSLNRIRLDKSNFIGALKSKLFWGEDVRNEMI